MPTSAQASSERLVYFTDAVAAIAITLLILPPVESVTEAPAAEGLEALIREHAAEFGAFAFSFALISGCGGPITASSGTSRPSVRGWCC